MLPCLAWTILVPLFQNQHGSKYCCASHDFAVHKGAV